MNIILRKTQNITRGFCLFIFILGILCACTNQPQAKTDRGTFKVVITNVRNTKGTIRVTLLNETAFKMNNYLYNMAAKQELYKEKIPKKIEALLFEEYINSDLLMMNNKNREMALELYNKSPNGKFYLLEEKLTEEEENKYFTFLKEFDNTFSRAVSGFSTPTVECEFENVPYGEYVIIVYHDENDNMKQDIRGEFPVEGFGISKNNGQYINFNTNKVQLHQNSIKTMINIYYFFNDTQSVESNINLNNPIHVNQDIYSMDMHMEEHLIQGKAVLDTFKVDISYVGAIDESKEYPVIYITDGYWRRNDHKYIHYLSELGKIPPVLVVGIGYPPGYDYGKIRERDFLQAPGKFLDLIKNEITPFVENKYPCDPSRRILFGASYGGSFLVYAFVSAAIEKDRTFSGFIGASAVFHRSKATGLMSRLPGPGEFLPYSLYMSYGENEVDSYFGKPLAEFIQILESRNYKDLHLNYYVNPGKDHYTVTRPTLVNGITIFLNNTGSDDFGFIDITKKHLSYDFSSEVQIYDWFYTQSPADLGVYLLGHGKVRDKDGNETSSEAMIAHCSFSDKVSSGIVGALFDHSENFTGTTFEYEIYIPGDLAKLGYSLQFYINTGYSWTKDISESFALDTPGWKKYTYTWKNDDIEGNIIQTREVGIIITKPDTAPGWEGLLYIDDINW